MDIIVRDSGMRRHTVIPDRDSTAVPSHSHLTVGGVRYVLFAMSAKLMSGKRQSPKTHMEQKLQEGIRLLVFQTNYSPSKPRLDEQCLLSGHLPQCVSLDTWILCEATHRMNPDYRMLGLHRLASNEFAVSRRTVSLLIAIMYGRETL